MTSPLEKRKTELVAELRNYGDPDDGKMVLPLDVYFEFAHEGSIGCNLSMKNAPEHIYRVLKEIEQRDDVDEIWVGINETMEDMEDEWFYSSRVYVVGTISEDELWQVWGLPPDWKNAPVGTISRRKDAGPDDIWHGWQRKGEPPPNLPHAIDETEVLMMDWD